MITPVLPTYARADLAFERGEGPWLFTGAGERYLDFGSGIAVNALGHANPRLIAALTDQAGRLWHTSNLYNIPGQQTLAGKLVANTFADTMFFTNSGAEAMECAIKMTRKFHAVNGQPERFHIITFEGAFHGRTLATIAAGGQQKYIEGFGPKVEGFDQVPFGDHEALKAAIGPHTGGILIEPIQGEGGVRTVPPQYLRGLRDLCDEHGLLLIFDEVQTGVGRTGKLFAHEWAGVTPDIMAIAKGIGGGFPMGACLATERAAAYGMTAQHAWQHLRRQSTLAMAVGNAVLDVVLEPGFLDHVQQVSLRLKQQLAMLKDEYPTIIEEIRGQGLLLGIKTRIPNTDLVAKLRDHKLLTVGAGDNVVRILPPLIVDDTHIAEAVSAIAAACADLATQASLAKSRNAAE